MDDEKFAKFMSPVESVTKIESVKDMNIMLIKGKKLG
tara:strand:+ start:462 stop:572 length:111 start_codon:yes stop_codon:yes gene_type:complete